MPMAHGGICLNCAIVLPVQGFESLSGGPKTRYVVALSLKTKFYFYLILY